MPISRRTFLGTVAMSTSLGKIPQLGPLFAGESEAQPENAPKKPSPSWLGKMPLVIAGNDDDFPLFRRREGGGTTWQEDEFRNEQSEETVRQLRDLGVTMIITHLFKGFGIEAEKEYWDNSLQLAKLARQNGMKVGFYVGSTIAYETFLLEDPTADTWLVPDFLGQPVFFEDQTFRKRVYFMHPGYRTYIRRVLEIGQREFQPDLIHFDNTSLQAEPAVFQHPLAVEEFRKYLRAKYSAAEIKKRLGFSDLKYVVPPKYGGKMSAINDPLFQEWAGFRCEQLTGYYAEMEQLLRELNPEIAVESNPHSGLAGSNTIWEEGISYPMLLAHMDAVWGEEGNAAGVTGDGILVSRIRSFKMASSLRNTLFVETGSSTLQMAESMAFGRQCLGYIADISRINEIPEQQRRYIRFFHENFEYYRDVEDVVDVALLYSHATMGFNNDRPQVSFMLCGQTLIQGKIPFTISFDQALRDLSKYKVLLLADQECLDDSKLALIRQFVSAGGGLVATEQSSLYTERRLRRPDFGLKDLFGVGAQPWQGRGIPEKAAKVGTVRNRVGVGKVAYLSEIRPEIEKPPADRMDSQYWKLPMNWKELVEVIRWAAGGQLSLEVAGPLTVVTEVTQQEEQGRLLVHFLNYDVASVPLVHNITAALRIPDAKRVKAMTLLTPDEPGTVTLPYTTGGGRVTFTLPKLATYSVVAIELV